MKKVILTSLMAITSLFAIQVIAQQVNDNVSRVPMLELNNGVKMPQFGLGTYMQPSNEVAAQLCLTALKAGYRHIDTAHAYNDEIGVGEGVRQSGIPRNEIWITSKLWPSEYGEGVTLKAIDEMLKRLLHKLS